MNPSLVGKSAVVAIRVSTDKQGRDGDSPEAQREQIDQFAKNKGIKIKEYFVFMESASKDQQPMQPAIDYCKKNNVDLFIIKSIDRFTRGGSDFYSPLKKQLDQCDVTLIDLYGVINPRKVNTLDHLGFTYKWSVYSPSKKTEILEAERAQDELRDIMSRMIGAEIRYTQMGYWMRQPPFGYDTQRLDTTNGKRTILVPHEEESAFVRRMFEMRASGQYTDSQVVDKLNSLGYQTRIRYTRHKNDPSKIVRQRGGNKLTRQHLWRFVRNPIYAGVNVEKWTNNQPVKCVFDGLVSLELFNKANKGRRKLVEDSNGKVYIVENKDMNRVPKAEGGKNPEFPYKRYVMCPQCNKPLLGSASRGKAGKYYPAYHCDKRGHYFRVSKQDLEAHVMQFISGITIATDKLDELFAAVESAWERANATYFNDLQKLENYAQLLEGQMTVAKDKIRVLSSPTAIKCIEGDLMEIEQENERLAIKKAELEAKKPVDIARVIKRVRYLVEHLEELLVQQIDPIKKAMFFGAIFDKLPTYEDIKSGTQKIPHFTGVNPVFSLLSTESASYGGPTGIRTQDAQLKRLSL